MKDVETTTLKPFRALIVVSPFRVYPDMDIPCVHFIPKVITYGIGLAHQAGPALEVMSDIDEVVEAHGMFNLAREYCTIDVKADEPVIKLLQTDPYPVRFHGRGWQGGSTYALRSGFKTCRNTQCL